MSTVCLEADVMCRCGYRKGDHKAANLTDGAFVGEYLLICPTAVFLAHAAIHPSDKRVASVPNPVTPSQREEGSS